MRRMRTMTAVVVAVCALACAMTVQAVKQGDGAMTKMGDGTVVVNTTSLCQVKGYRSTTPLKIFIKNDKIDHIEALKNQETPKYFKLVKDQILQAWNGKTVKKAVKQKVDGVTGATMSSDAVKANVKAGLEYYQKKK
ncbi:MAG: FMN-binding protein [Prevotella sp.]|nr:FMN-binding protein [Prevotella sp.]